MQRSNQSAALNISLCGHSLVEALPLFRRGLETRPQWSGDTPQVGGDREVDSGAQTGPRPWCPWAGVEGSIPYSLRTPCSVSDLTLPRGVGLPGSLCSGLVIRPLPPSLTLSLTRAAAGQLPLGSEPVRSHQALNGAVQVIVLATFLSTWGTALVISQRPAWAWQVSRA